jgi:nucleotide-binding universal stress UspA family protein
VSSTPSVLEADAPFDPKYSADDARQFLDDTVRSALDNETTHVTSTVVNDLPARALIDAAARAELLVVGARGLGGFRDLLLGSVSHRSLAHSPCPTVVVR